MRMKQFSYLAAPAAMLILVIGCSDDGSRSSMLIEPQFAPSGGVNVNLDQCANMPRTSSCTWQNGDLNKNNSTYAEGLVVPFRLAIEGLSPVRTRSRSTTTSRRAATRRTTFWRR